MAFLELKCEKCGHVFEELVRIGEYPKCPVCGGETSQKYNGKVWVNSVKPSNCTGNCKTCKGCH